MLILTATAQKTNLCSAAGRVPLTKVLCEWNQSVNCDFVPKQKTTLRIKLSLSFKKKKTQNNLTFVHAGMINIENSV